MIFVGRGKFRRLGSGVVPFGVSIKSRARVAVEPATFWAVHWYQAASENLAHGMSKVEAPLPSLDIRISGPGVIGTPSCKKGLIVQRNCDYAADRMCGNYNTFCHVIRGTGVPTARAIKTTGSPSFTLVVTKRSTNFGAITCSFSITFKLHWQEVSPALFRATHVTTPASERFTFVIINELLPDSFTRILWVMSFATCWPFIYQVTSGYGRPVTRQSNL